MFIEHNMPRHIDSARRTQTFVALVKVTIAKKNALSEVKLKLVTLIWTKARKTSTTKTFEGHVIRLFRKKVWKMVLSLVKQE